MANALSGKTSNLLSKFSILAFSFSAFLMWRVHVAWADLSAQVHLGFFQAIRSLFPTVDKPVEVARVSIWVLTEERIIFLFCVFAIALSLFSILLAMIARIRKESSVLYAGPAVLSIGIIYLASRFIIWMPSQYSWQ